MAGSRFGPARGLADVSRLADPVAEKHRQELLEQAARDRRAAAEEPFSDAVRPIAPLGSRLARVSELRLSDSVSTGSRDKSRVRAAEGRCAGSARGLRWLMPDGTLEPVRCGRSNQCAWCAMIAATTTALMLKLDAQLCQPTVGITTTTRRPDFTLEELRRAEAYLWEALRKRGYATEIGSDRRYKVAGAKPTARLFPDLRYCGFLEWTTGEGTHSDGHRRPHIHHLVKGIPAGHELLEVVDERRDEYRDGTREITLLELIVGELWRHFTGDAFVVEARPLKTPAGAIAYLALHHHKMAQAPPPGLRHVRRVRPSRRSKDRAGYYELLPAAHDHDERSAAQRLRDRAEEVAADERVRIAVKKAIGAEFFGETERQVDDEMTAAIADALGDLAIDPRGVRVDLEENVDMKAERSKLEEHALEQILAEREASPREMVKVFERARVDRETGVVYYEAVAVLGPIDPRTEWPDWLREEPPDAAEVAAVEKIRREGLTDRRPLPLTGEERASYFDRVELGLQCG